MGIEFAGRYGQGNQVRLDARPKYKGKLRQLQFLEFPIDAELQRAIDLRAA